MSIQANAVLTLISAVMWAMVGYLAKQEDEAFSPEKLFFTFFAAVIVSILTVGWSVPSELGQQFYEYLLYRSGLVAVTYKAIKAVYKYSGLKKWWEGLQTD